MSKETTMRFRVERPDPIVDRDVTYPDFQQSALELRPPAGPYRGGER